MLRAITTMSILVRCQACEQKGCIVYNTDLEKSCAAFQGLHITSFAGALLYTFQSSIFISNELHAKHSSVLILSAKSLSWFWLGES